MSADILRVETRRDVRRRRGKRVQHVFAALLLITTSIDHWSSHGISLLAVCELLAGVLLVAAVIRERLRPGVEDGEIAWVEFAGAIMTFMEAIERTRGKHHLSFVILSFTAPAVLLLFAIFDAEIAARHYIKVDDSLFEMRLRVFFPRRVALADVRGFRTDDETLEFTLTSGERRRFNYKKLSDGDAALAWTAEKLRARGVAELAA
jgi:uncharacterized membrane protein